MNLAEAAAFIRVSAKTLGEMARARKVPSQKVGREWRFSKSALQHWLESPSTSPAGKGYASDAGAASKGGVAEPDVQYALPFAGFRDTAFTENRDRTLHRWVPWIAGYSSSFVDDVIRKVANGRKNLTVLDPFAGVGTTLIESLKHGHDAIGFEINPYAALACRTKANAASYDVAKLRKSVDAFVRTVSAQVRSASAVPTATPPPGFVSRVPFFSPAVERQVLFVMDFIRAHTDGWVADVFRTALGSVMVSFSNYSYEPSLGTRAGANKPDILDADVVAVLQRKLGEMTEDISRFREWLNEFTPRPVAEVHPVSYFDGAGRVSAESVHLLVTSPPYLNNYHYIRNTRPHMFWLDMVAASSDLKEMEQKSFGQFWQTVRSGPEVSLVPELPELRGRIDDLRLRNPEKGAYGGEGWANYAACYFNDCDRFCEVTRRLMCPGGTAVVVIGNNILQGIEFATDRFFAEIAERRGFEIVELHEVRRKRTGNSIVNSSVRVGTVQRKIRLYETAVELRAPGS